MGCSASKPAAEAPAAAQAPTPASAPAPAGGDIKSLGVIRLDYDYPPAKGDIDHPGSFMYPVYYRVVPGLTFEMCQAGKMTPEVEKKFGEALKFLESKGVSAITGDCGFMMYFQEKVRQMTKLPVFMSSLAHLPAVTAGYSAKEKIAILTANSVTLAPMKPLIKAECGVEIDQDRFIIVGCQDVPGFEAVEKCEKVDIAKVTPGIVKKCKEVLAANPDVKAFLMECTQLPPFSDPVRHVLGKPVYDAITCCDYFMSGVLDNPRFGLNDWHQEWNGVQEKYKFGMHLPDSDKEKLVSKAKEEEGMKMSALTEPLFAKMKQPMAMAKRALAERSGASIGVIRVDVNSTPPAGDMNHAGSYAYDAHFRVVPGLTMAMCASGKLTDDIQKKLLEAVEFLAKEKGVKAIAGDRSVMLHFHDLVRSACDCPVSMSPLTQLPAITCGFSKKEKVAIFTLQGDNFGTMMSVFKGFYGSDFDESRFVVVPAQDIPGILPGPNADMAKAKVGIVAKAKEVMSKDSNVRAILLEATCMPPYSDDLRAATGLPVFDVITACDLLVSGSMDNPRFGSTSNPFMNWENPLGIQKTINWISYLTEEDQKKVNAKA